MHGPAEQQLPCSVPALTTLGVGAFLQDSLKDQQLTWEEIRDQIKSLSGLGYNTGEKKAKGKHKNNFNSTLP